MTTPKEKETPPMFVDEKADGERPISRAKQALHMTHAMLSISGVWVQFTPQQAGQDCLETALGKAFGWVPSVPWMAPRDFQIAYQAIVQAIKKLHAVNLRPYGTSVAWNERIAGWNDVPGRTLAEVLAVIKEAINLVDQVEAEATGRQAHKGAQAAVWCLPPASIYESVGCLIMPPNVIPAHVLYGVMLPPS